MKETLFVIIAISLFGQNLLKLPGQWQHRTSAVCFSVLENLRDTKRSLQETKAYLSTLKKSMMFKFSFTVFCCLVILFHCGKYLDYNSGVFSSILLALSLIHI